jgi:hypothetical protein
MSIIVTAARTCWPPPMGPALVGYNQQGGIEIVIPAKPKSVYKWMQSRCTKADLERVRKAAEREVTNASNTAN